MAQTSYLLVLGGMVNTQHWLHHYFLGPPVVHHSVNWNENAHLSQIF